jgi:hypothetical protein
MDVAGVLPFCHVLPGANSPAAHTASRIAESIRNQRHAGAAGTWDDSTWRSKQLLCRCGACFVFLSLHAHSPESLALLRCRHALKRTDQKLYGSDAAGPNLRFWCRGNHMMRYEAPIVAPLYFFCSACNSLSQSNHARMLCGLCCCCAIQTLRRQEEERRKQEQDLRSYVTDYNKVKQMQAADRVQEQRKVPKHHHTRFCRS